MARRFSAAPGNGSGSETGSSAVPWSTSADSSGRTWIIRCRIVHRARRRTAPQDWVVGPPGRVENGLSAQRPNLGEEHLLPDEPSSVDDAAGHGIAQVRELGRRPLHPKGGDKGGRTDENRVP